MISWLSQLACKRGAWIILALSALLLEGAALYFQYVLELHPCIKCVYQRTAIAGILFSALLAAAAPQLLIARLVGFVGWGVSAIWGAIIAAEHVEIQLSDNPFLAICGFEPDYPSWMPLHHWIPQVFNPTGMCGDIDWQFLGYTMPQVMLAIFVIYSAAFVACFIARLKNSRTL